MKKIVFFLSLVVILSLFVGCARQNDEAEPAEASPAAEFEVEEPTAVPVAEGEGDEPSAEEVATEEEEPAEADAAQEEAVPEEESAVKPPPMDDPELMPVERFEMFIDDLPVEGWGTTLAAGAALDPSMGPSNNGFPPFIFIDFSSPGDAVIPDPKVIFTFDVPQGRVFAVSPYLDMYAQGGDDYAQDAVSSLQQILDERPATLDEKLLTLPGFGDAQQGVRGAPTYIDFDGGSGVGFVAGYGQEIGPLLNDTLIYQFVGLTETHADTPFGTQYISFVFPLEATFLADLETVTDEEVAEAEADLDAYLAQKTEQINSAADTDYTPNLSAIKMAMQSISVNAGGEADEEASAPTYKTALLESPCYFMMPEGLSEEDVTCGMVEMPMNRDEPQGAKVRLPYVIVKSTNPEPRPDAFLYLVGGPGGSIVNRLTEQYHEWDPFRAEHDLIFYNQRGTVLSEPYIECTQYLGGIDFEQDREEIEAQMPEAWRPVREDTLSLPACIKIYQEKGVDFGQYNSLTNAQDAADLMQALGYEAYNLYGLSYGTRLALSIMRDRPELVRAVILDSNFPPNLDTMINTAAIGYEAGLQLFKECEQDEACNAAFPDLGERFEALRERLREEPLATGDESFPEITEVELLNHLMNTGVNPHLMAYVPLTIDQFENGSSDVFMRIVNRELPPPEEGADATPIPTPDYDFDYVEMNELSNDYEAAVEALKEVDREQYVQTRYEFAKQMMQGGSREQLEAFTENFPEETAADLKQRMAEMTDSGIEAMLGLLRWDFVAHIDTTDLVNLMVNCYDDYNHTTYDEATAPNIYDLPDELLESDRENNRDNMAKCSLIPSGRGPEWIYEAVNSDIPVLVFQGLADNNTPPSWSATMLPTLSNHFYVEVPASPHGVIQMGECVTDIAQEFLNNPDQEPDSSCVDQFESEFVIEPPPAEMPLEMTAFAPRVEEWPCVLWIPDGEVAGETIQCGYVVVPAERDNPQSEEVKLAFIRLKATGDIHSPDPIIHVAGGPGISATKRANVVELINRYAPLREMRDVILYDQRGVGNSRPFFDCYFFMGDDGGNEQQSEADESERCREAMRSQGYPPETFSTAVSAADLMDLMRALDYPAYNLYGISYGSRLLMSLMHYFPSEPLIRSIVLDSVDTLPEDYNTEYRAETYLLQQVLFESVFEACAANPVCAEAYPDLRTRFSDLTEELDRTPIKIDEYTTIDGDTIYRHFFPFNAAVQIIPYLPRMIAELERGDTTTLDLIRLENIPEPATRTTTLPEMPKIGDDLLELYLNCEGDDQERQITLWDVDSKEISDYLEEVCDSETAAAAIEIIDSNPGIFNHIISRYADDGIMSPNHNLNRKINCTEQLPFREDFGQIEASLRTAGMPNFFIEETLGLLDSHSDGCEVWQDALSTATPEIYGDYPTLILNGQFDALTPPAFAERASAAIQQAQYVPIPNAWHSVMGNNGDCPTNITLQFLTDAAAEVDSNCVEEMKVEFILPEE